MAILTNFNHPGAHEIVIMQSSDFPIQFFEYTNGQVGPYCGMHWHEHLEFVHIIKGGMINHCNSDSLPGKAGDIITINSRELHGYSLVETPIHLFCVVMDIGFLKSRHSTNAESKIISAIASGEMQFKNVAENDPVLIDAFSRLYHAYKGKGVDYSFIVRASMMMIVARLVKMYVKTSADNLRFNNRTLDQINNVILYIDEHYKENISLNELADTLGVTRYYFSRFFKKMTGSSPVDYLNNYRIHKAITLLIETDESITDIAMDVGFNDSNYFSRVFKNLTGNPPSMYRNRNGMGENQK